MIAKLKKFLDNKFVLIFLFIMFYLILYYDVYTCKLISVDEGYQLALNQWSFSKIIYYCSVDYHVPLFAFLVKIFSYIPVDVIFSSRILLSLIVIAHFFVAFFPLERLTNRKFAIIYSFAFLFSPLLIFFALNIRMYSLTNLNLFCVIIYSLLAFRDNTKNDFIKLFIFSVLSCYSFLLASFITFMILFIMIIYCFFKKKYIIMKKFIICFIGVALSFSLWVPVLLNQVSNVTSNRYWRYFPNSGMKFFMDITNIFIMSYYNGYCVSGKVWAVFMLLCCLMIYSILVNLIKRPKKIITKNKELFIIVLVITIISFLFILFYTYFNKTFSMRYFVILYSMVLFIVIYYLFNNFKVINKLIFLIFILLFYFNYSEVINSKNLSSNNYLNLLVDNLVTNNEDNYPVYHVLEGSIETLFIYDITKFNNYIVYNSFDENHVNVLRDYKIFGNNVYTIDNIYQLSKYTNTFFMISIEENLGNDDNLYLIDFFNKNRCSYKLIGSYYSGYNKAFYNLYKVNFKEGR